MPTTSSSSVAAGTTVDRVLPGDPPRHHERRGPRSRLSRPGTPGGIPRSSAPTTGCPRRSASTSTRSEMYRELEDEVGAAILHQTKGIFWLASHRDGAAHRACSGGDEHRGRRQDRDGDPGRGQGAGPPDRPDGWAPVPGPGASHHLEAATARHDRVAWAYAAGAARRGVHVIQHTPVTGLVRDGDRIVGVETPRGPIAAGIVLSAVGGRDCTGCAGRSPPPSQDAPTSRVRDQRLCAGVRPIVASTELMCYVSQTERGQMLIGAEFDAQPRTRASRRSRPCAGTPTRSRASCRSCATCGSCGRGPASATSRSTSRRSWASPASTGSS